MTSLHTDRGTRKVTVKQPDGNLIEAAQTRCFAGKSKLDRL